MKSMLMPREDVIPRLEPHLHQYLRDEEYRILEMDPASLLTPERLDLAIKVLYLSTNRYSVELSKKVYSEHIYSFTLGSYCEPGDPEKNSLEKYISTFEDLQEDFSRSGFSVDESIIPISPEGVVLNGAHRVSAALYLGKSVCTVQIPTRPPCYDYNFFLKRGMSARFVDMAAISFVENALNTYVALLWPSAGARDEDIARWLPNIIHRKDLHLTHRGGENLLAQVYAGAPWLNDHNSRYSGIKSKLAGCFDGGGPVKVIAFQCRDSQEVLQLKSRIRKHYGIGNHSVHITDTPDEAIELVRLAFNENTEHFLNNAEPKKFRTTHERIDKFREFLRSSGISPKTVVVDSGLILSVYGLRQTNDIDYLSLENISADPIKEIDCHESALVHHVEGKSELIFNPKYHFYYSGLKFVSFEQLYRMKVNRKTRKDMQDIVLMKTLIDAPMWKKFIRRCRRIVTYFRMRLHIRTKNVVKNVLHRLNLYHFVRDLYRHLWPR